MKIHKVLNNNAVVVKEEGIEKIVMGSGIAFQKGKNDVIDTGRIEKVFILKGEGEKFQELLQTVPEAHIALAEEIISYAEKSLDTDLNDHIHIALTDHLSFVIERSENGLPVRNKLLNEIKVLYADEYRIGLWAIEKIKNQLGVTLPEDEAGYIAFHIHTSKTDSGSLERSTKQAIIIRDMIDIITSCLNVKIDVNSVYYQRLLTHLQFVLIRIENEEPFHTMDEDMLEIIKLKYKQAYRCATKIACFVQPEYGKHVPESEIGYIALHIERMYEKV